MHLVLLLSALLSLAATPIFGQASSGVLPARDLRAGMRGTGYTVFQGTTVEPFQAEILGVLENAGPKQSIILARLSGGPIERTGVLQGMSGSPVYVNGKLIGAVALAFSLAKEPIAGIRPFEEMLTPKAVGASRRLLAEAAPPPIPWGEAKLQEIATPMSFSGFTPATIQNFAPQLRALGLEPRQGLPGGGTSTPKPGNAASLKPGSMISVQLVSGDMAVGADGTVTHIDGKKIYAFGHRFLSAGPVEMPFASSEVLTLLPNLEVSFKISTARERLGVITQDYSTAIQGELGRTARTIPVSISLRGVVGVSDYKMDIVRDAALTPFLLQMVAFSAIDATERTMGGLSYTVEQTIQFRNAPSYKASNIYSGEFNTPQMAAQSGAIPVSFVMQAGFPDLEIQSISLNIDAQNRKRQAIVEDAFPLRRSVRPGETVPVQVILAAEGKRIVHNVDYKVPVGAQTGTLQFTVTDGPTANLLDLRQQVGLPARQPADVSHLLAALRPNDRAYVRVWRAEAAYSSQGRDLPGPPPSVAGILARSQSGSGIANFTTKLAELVLPGENLMVSGSKTFAVEVKE
ncbi:MAG: hypothetical protein JNK87_40960 [Bryobacterales bacterium]|nr:hypothetical protein [Bryobacterales bacterium]